MLNSGSSYTITFTVKAELDQIPQIKESLEKIMNESGFGQHEVLEVLLAAEEACTNIVHHAYEDKAGLIYFLVRVKTDRLEIMIKDDGPPFDPTKQMNLHHNTNNDAEGHVGGWGIGLIRMLVDEIAYERCSGKNILCLIKKK